MIPEVYVEIAVFHLMWMAPLAVGLVGSLRLWRSAGPPDGKVSRCFLWALLAILVGYVGVYINWRGLNAWSMWSGEVRFEEYVVGVRKAVAPAVTGGLAAAALLALSKIIQRSVPAVPPGPDAERTPLQ